MISLNLKDVTTLLLVLVILVGVSEVSAQNSEQKDGYKLLQDEWTYKEYIAPLIPGTKDAPGRGGEKAQSVAIRNPVVGNAALEVLSQSGHIPEFLRGTSGQQEDGEITARKSGLILPAPFAGVAEVTKGEAYVDITDRMVQNHALAQLYMTLYMTDPAVAQAATSSYSLATSLVGNMYTANDSIYNQLDSMNEWQAERTLATLTGCQQRTSETGEGFKIASWIKCVGDSAVDIDDGLMKKHVETQDTELANPKEHVAERKEGQTPSHINGDGQLSLVTDFFAMRQGGKLGSKWKEFTQAYVRWFGDYVGNFSGGNGMTDDKRKPTGKTWSSYFIPTKTLHPEVNYFELFSDTKSDAYDGLRNIIKQMCEEYKDGSNPHNSSMQWKHGDKQKLLDGGINDYQWRKVTLRDFRPSPLFFTAMFNQLQMKQKAESGVCQQIHSLGDESKLTPDNKLIVPFQILYWMAESIAEVRFYDMFIAFRDRILAELDGDANRDSASRLIGLINRRANLGVAETLESRREQVIARLNELHEAGIKKEAPIIGSQGGMLAATFSSSSAGTTNNGGIDG